ncbi:MAG TPA: B12-binding domain-containing radical SAM protein, partial [Desulfobacterales bacterium]|nr:B12-binding domain-containing radical SAM protein [Desulfobacterales bacterium]
MRCHLIVPAWEPEEIFPSKTAASQINYWQPLGILYVAAALQRADHSVRFLNGAFLSHQDIIAAVQEEQPAFVGLYATTFGWPRACRTAKAIKEASPASLVAVGGPYPIAAQEACLRECRAIDAAVTGEGEITVVEMLARLAAGQDLAGVAGVVFRRGAEIVRNPPRPLITDLDALPFPARELLGDDEYIPPPATYKRKPVAVLITSRGCNRRCIYCFQIDKSRASGIRYRSIDNVMAEIEHCLAQGYRE